MIQHWLIVFGMNHQYLIYILIIALACAEGPILSILFGVLLRLGYFSLVPVYASLMVGDLIGDVIWYGIGYHYGRAAIKKFGKRFGITEESVVRVEKLFHKHKNKILFISKITNGFGFALVTLMTAGIARIPFLRYMAVNLTGQFIWSGSLLAVGYFFSQSYLSIHTIFGRASLVAVFAALIVLVFFYAKNLRKKL